jgi:flagellar hook-length control protein FliK
MQFFPASMSHGAQSFRANSAFEMPDSRPGQDFHGLFSAHLEHPDATSASPQTDQPQPAFNSEQVYADDHGPAGDSSGGGFGESSSFAEENASASSDAALHEDGRGEEKARESAKAAVQQPDASSSKQADSSADAPSENDREVMQEQSGAQAPDVSDDSVAVAVQELLDSLAAEAKTRGAESHESGLSDKIEALHELLRQFRQSDPATRSELAVNLGEQVKSLKAELAAAALKRADAAGEPGRRNGNAEKVSSGVMQKMDALVSRLETFQTGGRQGVNIGTERAMAAASLAEKAGVMAGEEGARARSGRALLAESAEALATDGETLTRKQGAGLEPENHAAQKSGKGSEITFRSAARARQASDAAQGQSGARRAALEVPDGKSASKLEIAEESLASEQQQGESVATGADRKYAAVKDPGSPGRSEHEMTRSGLAAAGTRPATAKDGSGQSVPLDVGSTLQEGEAVSTASAAAADSKGEKKQPDAHQGFFGSPDREKSSSSTSRAAQTAGNAKNAPESQTLSQTAAQNSQSQFQQRLESPVSARSAQVYQQVENGAFRNLGQGVKQLVIRLDPADLGQVSVILQVRGKEVQAVLRSSNQETSVALNEQLGQLRTQLEAQGLKVGKLEVQTQLADSQSQSQWQGAENHNRYQENQELAMSAKRWRTLERVAPDLVRDVQNSRQGEKLSQSGLDIFA